MKKIFIFLCFCVNAQAQDISGRLAVAFSKLEADPSMKHGLLGLCVEDANGNPVFKKNSELGMAVASSQKVFTSAASFELLGPDFRFHTSLWYQGNIKDSVLDGDLVIRGSGDPSLGSSRWSTTKPETVLTDWVAAIRQRGINAVNGFIYIDPSGYSHQTIPDGWIWQDIGNYYGAGAGKVNWKENQYDLHLRSQSATGSAVEILNDRDSLGNTKIYLNELRSAERGTGDNANIYLPFGTSKPMVSGTIPRNEKDFAVAGAIPQPEETLIYDLRRTMLANGIQVRRAAQTADWQTFDSAGMKLIDDHSSPPFDSLNYWFLKRSINLYGEALIKAIAVNSGKEGSTNAGVELVREFWNAKGIERSSLKIIDGSGLSPQNRVTTAALVHLMHFAMTRPWFGSFYEALPLINGIKMKSGSIGGARSFTGYIKKGEKINYVFAIVVNNYDGPSDVMVRKLYTLLDVLK